MVRLFPGVYAVAELATDVETRIRAAALWSGRGVMVGAAAAKVTFWPELTVTTISVASPTDRMPPPGINLCRERMPAEVIIEHRGLRMTTPALTALDLGAAGIDRALLRGRRRWTRCTRRWRPLRTDRAIRAAGGSWWTRATSPGRRPSGGSITWVITTIRATLRLRSHG